MISLDTEDTGVDFFHGAKPFLVTVCHDDGEQQFWEWDVDPMTREPDVPVEDVLEIQAVLDAADRIAMQNPKFDCHALETVGIALPWDKVLDTLRGGHLLASNHKHNLTDMCIEYLGHDIEHFEIAVKEATVRCRAVVRREFPDWKTATEDDPDMPSVSGGSKRDEDKPWKCDMWLMRAYIAHQDTAGQPWTDDPAMVQWLTVTSEYANADSAVTLPLMRFMEAEIKNRGLWKIYLNMLKLSPIACDMERHGVTISAVKTEEQIAEYGTSVDLAQAELMLIAEQHGHDLELPKGAGANDSLREMFYGSTRLTCPRCGVERRHKEWQHGPLNGDGKCKKCLKLKIPISVDCDVRRNPCLAMEPVFSAKSKSGGPTLDKDAMDHYEATLDPGPALDFVRELRGMRSRQTAISYLQSYKGFWVSQDDNWCRLHPSLNPTGTHTLRWSSSNPNSQNFSKKENFNIRRVLGPAPGREWWSMDGKNLELRIPAYESGETDLIWVFDHPDDPPYFGSYHLVVFDVLYPELFAEHGKQVKDLYESTYYQWIKNGNFAVIYGCQQKKADQTYHLPGAFDLVRDRFPRIAALADKQKKLADHYGYVETIPDRTVCAERGYPILASRTDDGRVSPTTPLNYHISGTAMQWTCMAMIRCDEQIKRWNAEGWDGFMTLQVHDEVVFDMPCGEGTETWRTNLERAMMLKGLMEEGGRGIGVPTPVSVEYHDATWATGMTL